MLPAFGRFDEAVDASDARSALRELPAVETSPSRSEPAPPEGEGGVR
jgi:hypothetical protein